MTPKQKAEELVEKFRLNVLDYENNGLNSFKAKQCALIAVNEILSVITNSNDYYIMSNYYQQVKKEIEKL